MFVTTAKNKQSNDHVQHRSSVPTRQLNSPVTTSSYSSKQHGLLNQQKRRTRRLRLPSSSSSTRKKQKHVILALTAGVWCLCSVGILLRSSSSSSSSSSNSSFSRESLENTMFMSPQGTTVSTKDQRQGQFGRDGIRHVRNGQDDVTVRTIPSTDWNSERTRQTQDNDMSLFQPPFGFVMTELAQRILSRHVANSNVLVIAPDAQEAASIEPTTTTTTTTKQRSFSLGGTMMLHAKSQGHTVHAMNAGMKITKTNVRSEEQQRRRQQEYSYTSWNTTLDEWWSDLDGNDDNNNRRKRPNWFLLAVVDPGFQWEDLVWQNSQQFRQRATITYVVTAVRSRLVMSDHHDDEKKKHTNSSSLQQQQHSSSTTTKLEMYGLDGVQALIQQGYKMQVLQLSHYDIGSEMPSSVVFEKYGPNALLSSDSDVTSLLSWGARAARKYDNANNTSSSSSSAAAAGGVFTAYLFGTQGLDLAIPSRRQYIHDGSRLVGDESWTQINLYKPVKFHPCRQSRDVQLDIEFRASDVSITQQSPNPHDMNVRETLSPLALRLRNSSPLIRKAQNTWHDVRRLVSKMVRHSFSPAYDVSTNTPGISITSTVRGGSTVTTLNGSQVEMDGTSNSLQLWHDQNDPRSSEAICVRNKDAVKCKTRIIRPPERRGRPHRRRGHHKLRQMLSSSLHANAANNRNLDLLVIMLDPMSRGHFHRSMPRTRALLEDELNFLQFTQYSAVGDNSGPNQAALYSGRPLADRDGIASDGQSEWLWDTLRNAGYVTLKGEDGCIENSNMLQSLKPKTSHGEALNSMFCFDFNRPNCLGSQPAASYLLRYGMQFIDEYGSTGNSTSDDSSSGRRPWAAFLHFVDSHEDTMTLSTMIDPLIVNFLNETFSGGRLSNAMVMVLSDHGLHYGPYFQTLSGRRERTEPLLYIHTPPNVRTSRHGRTMEANAPLWTTPFDVYQTMIDLTVGSENKANKHGKAESLLTPLPDSRKSCRGTTTIPDRFCDLHDMFAGNVKLSETCPPTPRAPSILSFYADIPRHNRPNLLKRNCSRTEGEPFDFDSECICGTSHHDIYPCKEHPWGPGGANSTVKSEEYFAVIKCKNRVERLDSRVMRRQEIVDRYYNATSDDVVDAATSKDRPTSKRSPDVLVLEIDSVSKAYAERHLPRTIQFLKKHRIRKDKSGRDRCTNGVCALNFDRFAVVGANSVANQVPALSGCLVSRFHQSCFDQTYATDKCYENGLFGTEDGCEACPVGTFPRDPLSPCNTTKTTPEKCCTDAFPGYNATRICRDESLFEHNLQLFRRGPRRHTTWCPTRTDATSKSSPWLFDVARSKGYITYFAEEFCYDYSPYVTQDNTFPLHTDFELRKVYCRLQSCLENCEGPWPPMGPHICLETDGENPAFAQIDDIWKAYPDVPKFAFLNGIAAHDYNFGWLEMIASLEAYDVQLASFLERIVASPNFGNTVIVVRTDHGLQGGPTTVDYSVQVEHRGPWTQMILPEKLVSEESLRILSTNQDRLATGYDLYHSFRNLMSATGKDGMALPVPDWSWDMFQTEIPRDRSCVDAKIPEDFCPCEGTSNLDRAPHFGVCNVFEPYNDLFCASDQDSPILPENPE